LQKLHLLTKNKSFVKLVVKIHRWRENRGNLKQHRRKLKNEKRSFSMALLDESTDVSDTEKLAVLFRGMDTEFNITEESVALMPTKGTTTRAD
jgi:hypothetical protein